MAKNGLNKGKSEAHSQGKYSENATFCCATNWSNI